jgi:hypothetical protein
MRVKNKSFLIASLISISGFAQNSNLIAKWNFNGNANDSQDKDVTPTLVLKSGATYYSISRIVDCELQQIIYYTGNGGISILSAYHNKRTEELYNKTCVGENK